MHARHYVKFSILPGNRNWLAYFLAKHQMWVVVAGTFKIYSHFVFKCLDAFSWEWALHYWNFFFVLSIRAVSAFRCHNVFFNGFEIRVHFKLQFCYRLFLLSLALLSLEQVVKKRIVTESQIATLVLLQTVIFRQSFDVMSGLRGGCLRWSSGSFYTLG